jgi:hypothetical protein
MNQYFRCKVKVSFEDAKGNQKWRGEEYIVSAVNPTDVEAKIVENLKGYDIEIVSISVTKILDIVL